MLKSTHCNEWASTNMSPHRSKSLMRSLGEFIGHIAKGVRTDPRKKVVKKVIEQEQRDDLILRRTTIEEIEVRPKKKDGNR